MPTLVRGRRGLLSDIKTLALTKFVRCFHSPPVTHACRISLSKTILNEFESTWRVDPQIVYAHEGKAARLVPHCSRIDDMRRRVSPKYAGPDLSPRGSKVLSIAH